MPIIYFTNNYNNNDTIVFQRFDGSSLISPDASDYGGRKVDWEALSLCLTFVTRYAFDYYRFYKR